MLLEVNVWLIWETRCDEAVHESHIEAYRLVSHIGNLLFWQLLIRAVLF